MVGNQNEEDENSFREMDSKRNLIKSYRVENRPMDLLNDASYDFGEGELLQGDQAVLNNFDNIDVIRPI